MHVVVRTGRRWLYLGHRWIGIGTCLLFAIWFVSGVVMMYVPFPALTADERLQRLPLIDWNRVRVDPTSALAALGDTRFPRELRLEMRGELPVYRVVDWAGQPRMISAFDATPIVATDAATAATTALLFESHGRLRSTTLIERDQWTVAGRYDRHRPLYVASFDDKEGTRLYLSSHTGEVVLDTTASERFWNWLGAVPHWIYFTALRMHQPAWRQVIIWVSGVSIVGAAAGLWIGILRLRLRRRYRGRHVTPYREWMKWHHIAGLLGGAFLLTWIVSGYLSVNPNHWFRSSEIGAEALQRYAGHTTPDHPVNPAALRSLGPRARQVRFAWVDGRPLILVEDERGTTIRAAPTLNIAQLTDTEIFSAAQRIEPSARITRQHRLAQEDAYWYSHHRRRPLPVLRVTFDDADETWLHLRPESGEILGSLNRSDRAYRWWFDALHSLDYALLLQHRPAWDIVVWTLSALGLIASISGVVIGWRRLFGR